MSRLAIALVALASCVGVVGACGRPASQTAVPAASRPGAALAALDDDDPASGDSSGLVPPDGTWLVDERGRRYFLEPIARTQAVRLDGVVARTVWGTRIEVAREDAAHFYYKVYAPGESPRPERRDDEAAAERLAESYRAETPESHRLRFVAFADGLPRSGQWRDGFDIADMNADGHPDIIHGPARKGSRVPVIFLGDGRGGWRAWREARFPGLVYDYGDVQVGDLDGDGHLDLVLSAHLRGLTALRGNGRGAFTDWSRGLDRADAASPPGFSSRAIRLVDWNGDGRLDLLALGEGARRPVPGAARVPPAQGVALYLNGGDGSWGRRTGETDIVGTSLVLGDFDGDGRMDFATGSSVFGRTDIVNLATADGRWVATAVDRVRPRAFVRAVSAGDLDGDGRADLAVAYLSMEADVWRTGIDVLSRRADGRWTRRVLAAEEGRRGVTALAAGDLDGDGRRDLVALTDEGHTWVFPGDGKGFFTRERAAIPLFVGGCRGSRVVLADLDGDGRDEVIASFAQEAGGGPSAGACPSEGGLAVWKAAGIR